MNENLINPNLKQAAPIFVDLEAGQKLAWCTCGWSAKDPYCDGSHREKTQSELKSCHFEVAETKRYALCGCKQTKNPPYCDGSHAR